MLPFRFSFPGFLLPLLAGAAAWGASYPKSDHFDGSRFFNPDIGPIEKGLPSVLKWKFFDGERAAAWPAWVETPTGPALAPRDGRGAAATFVNHATFVVRFPGAVVLTDPIWSERCSPFSFAGPKRAHAPGVKWDDVPKVDVVVLSHNHFDHLDLPTLRRIDARDHSLFLVPLGLKAFLRDEGIRRVEELDWWQSRQAAGVTFTLLPARHWSVRVPPLSRNKSLWGGWGMTGADGTRVYHVGDSGYGPDFKRIHERWGAPDLALIPIGAYDPRWFMKTSHMDPEEAVRVFDDLGARRAVAMHFGTFQLTDEARDEPGERLRKAAGGRPFFVPQPGEGFFATED